MPGVLEDAAIFAKYRRIKKHLWDPISSAAVLALGFFAMQFLFSFESDSTYKGGIEGSMQQWTKKPIINMEWVGAKQACSSGFKDIPVYNQLFLSTTLKKSVNNQKRLCVQRGGVPSDEPGDEARPRSQCVKQGMQTCMTGKFPYCGQKGVQCPLVDVADFMQTGNEAAGFNMRTTCNTSIPAALLPWMGCRPLVDVVLSSEQPCFQYNMHGWGRRDRPPSVVGSELKKCIRKDDRYRFMKAFPFVDGAGVVHRGANAGIFVRHELFYNPKCSEPQDRFEDGYIWMHVVTKWFKGLLGLNIVIAFYVAIRSLFSRSTNELREPQPRFKGKKWDFSASFVIFARFVALGLTTTCAAYTFWLLNFFAPLTLDRTCVDMYLFDIVVDVVTTMRQSTLIIIFMGSIMVIQLALDFFFTPPKPVIEGHEGAPLLRTLPSQYDEKSNVQTCDVDPDVWLRADATGRGKL